MSAKKPIDKIRRTIERLIEEDPDAVIEALVESSFWPRILRQNTLYIRRDDDTAEGEIMVSFSHDGDAWIEVQSKPDPEEFNLSHRYRTFFGGGASLRTYQALIILALAIKLDNEKPRL